MSHTPPLDSLPESYTPPPSGLQSFTPPRSPDTACDEAPQLANNLSNTDIITTDIHNKQDSSPIQGDFPYASNKSSDDSSSCTNHMVDVNKDNNSDAIINAQGNFDDVECERNENSLLNSKRRKSIASNPQSPSSEKSLLPNEDSQSSEMDERVPPLHSLSKSFEGQLQSYPSDCSKLNGQTGDSHYDLSFANSDRPRRKHVNNDSDIDSSEVFDSPASPKCSSKSSLYDKDVSSWHNNYMGSNYKKANESKKYDSSVVDREQRRSSLLCDSQEDSPVSPPHEYTCDPTSPGNINKFNVNPQCTVTSPVHSPNSSDMQYAKLKINGLPSEPLISSAFEDTRSTTPPLPSMKTYNQSTNYTFNDIKSSISKNDSSLADDVRSPCTPPLPPISPPPIPPPPSSPPPLPPSSPPPLPPSTPPPPQSHLSSPSLSPFFSKSRTSIVGAELTGKDSGSRDSFADKNSEASEDPELSNSYSNSANAQTCASSPFDISEKMATLISQFQENHSTQMEKSLMQRRNSKSDLHSEDPTANLDDKEDISKKFESFIDNANSSSFLPPPFTSFLPSGNDIFEAQGALSSIAEDSGSASGSDSDDSDMKDTSQTSKKKHLRTKSGKKERDTPSPITAEQIECPPSPKPQFESPDSSRSPSPAPTVKVGEKRRKSEMSDGSGSGSELGVSNNKWRKGEDTRDVSQIRSDSSYKFQTRHLAPLTINTAIPPPIPPSVPPPVPPPPPSHVYGLQKQHNDGYPLPSLRTGVDILSPTGSSRGEILSPTSTRGDILSPTSNMRCDILSPNGLRDGGAGGGSCRSLDVMSPVMSNKSDVLSPPSQSPRYESMMSPGHNSSYHHSHKSSSYTSYGNHLSNQDSKYSNNSTGSHSSHHHHHHHHRSSSGGSGSGSSRSRRARSPMDLPVPKWNIDPIYTRPKTQIKTPPYQKERPGRTPPYQRESSYQKEKEIIILPVEPRRVAIPPSAEKLRRYSEDKDKTYDRDRSKRLSIESIDSPRNRSFDDLPSKVSTVERSNSVGSQGSLSKIGSDADPILMEVESSEPESKTKESISGEGEPSNSSGKDGKVDFQKEVLGELGEFAECGDTSIYTGPECEIIERKLPAISRIRDEEMNLLSPTKSRSKLPTSTRKSEGKASLDSSDVNHSLESSDAEESSRKDSIVVACIDTKIVKSEVKAEEDLDAATIKIFESSSTTPSKVETQESPVQSLSKTTDVPQKEQKTDTRSHEKAKELSKHRSKNNSTSSGQKSDRSDTKRGSGSSHESSSRHHHKESSSSSSSRKNDCSRCYKRSKIKRYNIGVQCKRDKTDTVKNTSASIDTSSSDSANKAAVNTDKESSTLATASVSSTTVREDQKTRIPLPRPKVFANDELEKYKFGHLMHIEVYPNGGAKVCHMYEDELTHLTAEERELAAREFLEVRFLYYLLLNLIARKLVSSSFVSIYLLQMSYEICKI